MERAEAKKHPVICVLPLLAISLFRASQRAFPVGRLGGP